MLGTHPLHFHEEEEKASHINHDIITFQDAVVNLHLPPHIPHTMARKSNISTFDMKDKFHTVEVIDLSNF